MCAKTLEHRRRVSASTRGGEEAAYGGELKKLPGGEIPPRNAYTDTGSPPAASGNAHTRALGARALAHAAPIAAAAAGYRRARPLVVAVQSASDRRSCAALAVCSRPFSRPQASPSARARTSGPIPPDQNRRSSSFGACERVARHRPIFAFPLTPPPFFLVPIGFPESSDPVEGPRSPPPPGNSGRVRAPPPPPPPCTTTINDISVE